MGSNVNEAMSTYGATRGESSPSRDARIDDLRASRRAALNLMEDAVRARADALQANASLQQRIDERTAAEAALRESEAQLDDARREFRQFQESFEARVKERTQELQNREERLRDLATLLKRTEQRERQRLARLLHDHVQQLLVAAKMRIDGVAGQLDEHGHLISSLLDSGEQGGA